ncbi:GATA transcription factor [Quillaja saponaria]|uniref:GATA transcription factor n=1 Tax=Quillaja saponaria TaxID=32244 RepID=A0AAD7VDJ4_QUISA|nr:GATA transcription factor [Quillaja saponaria]
MDICQNVSVSSECKGEQVLSSSPCSKLAGFSSSLDDLFSAQNTEIDVSLEWLSTFVEDCFSSRESCLQAPSNIQTSIASAKPSSPMQKTQQNQSHVKNLVVPGKGARSKRKRVTTPKTKNPFSIWSQNLNPQNQILPLTNSDPLLLKQTYWLADSELIVPKKDGDDEHEQRKSSSDEETEEVEKGFASKDNLGILEISKINVQPPMPRRCTHCLAQRTPQWRAGPLGPKTLCNACGVRYKSGRLLPEYRPAKSPTFVSYLHSNSHKKVMEMRNENGSSVVSSITSEQ